MTEDGGGSGAPRGRPEVSLPEDFWRADALRLWSVADETFKLASLPDSGISVSVRLVAQAPNGPVEDWRVGPASSVNNGAFHRLGKRLTDDEFRSIAGKGAENGTFIDFQGAPPRIAEVSVAGAARLNDPLTTFLAKAVLRAALSSEAPRAHRLVEQAVHSLFGTLLGLNDVESEDRYHGICRLATERYESKEARGHLGVSTQSDPVAPELRFSRPVALAQSRRARKVLEVSGGEFIPVWDLAENSIVGIARRVSFEGKCKVRFRSRGAWDLVREDRDPLLHVQHGRPILRDPAPNQDWSRALLPFARFTFRESLEFIATRLVERGKGASFVVSPDPKREAARLAGQGTWLVTPAAFDRTLVEQLCTVDGAVFFGPDGRIFGYGVILDGAAGSPEGNPERGSRYNGSWNYVRTRLRAEQSAKSKFEDSDDEVTQGSEERTFSIVVSEDGAINVIDASALRQPRIHGSWQHRSTERDEA